MAEKHALPFPSAPSLSQVGEAAFLRNANLNHTMGPGTWGGLCQIVHARDERGRFGPNADNQFRAPGAHQRADAFLRDVRQRYL